MSIRSDYRGADGFMAMLGEADAALDEGLEAGIRGLVDCVTRSMTVGGAGLMLADQHRVLRSSAATSAAGRLLQTGQERLGAGPAIDSYERSLPVSSSDIRSDDRWPDLRYLLPCQKARSARSACGGPRPVAGASTRSPGWAASPARRPACWSWPPTPSCAASCWPG